MVKVKICGNRTFEDLNAACGADALGFIVATPESSRNLTSARAARLVNKVRPFTSTVLVTTETHLPTLVELVREVGPDYLQLHSDLSPNKLERIANSTPEKTGLIALLSVNFGERRILNRAQTLAKSPAEAILLDSKVGGKPGGTGKVHDWEVSRKIRDDLSPFPVILAGGLRPENVTRAITEVRPYAVDVATGVKENGTNSAELVKSLLKEVKDVET